VILLGLLLIAVAVAAVTGVAVSSTDTAPLQVFGHSAHSHQVGVIFVAGAIAGVVFAIGASMVFGALGRRRVRRRDAKRAERTRVAEQRALRERNAELERSLAHEQSQTTATSAPATGNPTATSAPSTVDLDERDRRYAER
jgi:hypothetical protein